MLSNFSSILSYLTKPLHSLNFVTLSGLNTLFRVHNLESLEHNGIFQINSLGLWGRHARLTLLGLVDLLIWFAFGRRSFFALNLLIVRIIWFLFSFTIVSLFNSLRERWDLVRWDIFLQFFILRRRKDLKGVLTALINSEMWVELLTAGYVYFFEF